MIIEGEVFDARQEAKRILDAARAEAERLREAARRDGFAAGREEGLAAVSDKLVRAAAAAERSAAADEDALVRLAVRIAEKIIRRQLDLAPDTVRDVARAALAAARARDRLTLHVHPEDAALVAPLGVPVVADPAVARGGCVVDTDLGRFDARLDVQLAAIERALVP
jgi:flagellar biosynthesis/type III secretory pathway protein FliH